VLVPLFQVCVPAVVLAGSGEQAPAGNGTGSIRGESRLPLRREVTGGDLAGHARRAGGDGINATDFPFARLEQLGEALGVIISDRASAMRPPQVGGEVVQARE
jgi:hypothetical protein